MAGRIVAFRTLEDCCVPSVTDVVMEMVVSMMLVSQEA